MMTLLSKFGNWFLRNSRNVFVLFITTILLLAGVPHHHSFASEVKNKQFGYIICEPNSTIIHLFDFPDNYYYWEGNSGKDYFAIIHESVDVFNGQYLLGRVYTHTGKELKSVSGDSGQKNNYSLDGWYFKSEEWDCSFKDANIKNKIAHTNEFENIKEKFEFIRLHSLVSNKSASYYKKSIGCAVKDYENLPRLFTKPDIYAQLKNHVYRDRNPSFSFEKFHITANGTFMEGRIVDGRARPVLRRIDMSDHRYRLTNNWFVFPEEWVCLIYQ